MRIARNLTQKGREEGELDAPAGFWWAEEVMLYERLRKGGTYRRKQTSQYVRRENNRSWA